MAVKEKKDMTKKQGSVKPMASEQVNTITPVVGDKPAVKFDESGKPVLAPVETTTEIAARLVDAGAVGFPQGSVAEQVESAPSVGIAPEVKAADVPVPEQAPDERLGLAGQVENTPSGLNNVASVNAEDAPIAEQPEMASPLAELYKMFNPEPKQRAPEEQEKFEKSRRASSIILGVADAINGLSNLGATVAGAPSREVVSIAGKWSEAITAAEEKRKKAQETWQQGLMRYAYEDIKNARDLAQRKADRETQLKDNKELAKYRAELDKSAREHAAGIKAEQDEAANAEWDRRAEVQQENELEQIEARGKQSQIEAGIRAAASASNADAKKPTFAATILGTPVDVALRKESDYSALFDLIKAEAERSGDAESKSALAALNLELENAAGDKIKSAAHKKGYVMENFAKYYDKIKGNPMYKHLSVEFRDGAGNPVEFKPAEPEKPRDLSNDPITKNLQAESSQSFTGVQPTFNNVDSPWLKK